MGLISSRGEKKKGGRYVIAIHCKCSVYFPMADSIEALGLHVFNAAVTM